jgi:hypothetical protein
MSVNPVIKPYIAARTQCAIMGATARVRFGGAEYVGIRGTPRDSRDVGAPGRGSMDSRNMTVRLLATELKGDAPKAGDQIDLMGARSTWEPRAVVDVQHATDAATVLLTLGGQYA